MEASHSFSRAELESWALQHVGLSDLDLSRLSSVLLGQLLSVELQRLFSVFSVTDEIRALEGRGLPKKTGSVEAFRGDVLRGLHKKHFTDARFVVENLIAQFGVRNGGNSNLTRLVERVFSENKSGEVDEDFCRSIAHYASVDALEKRASKNGLTGEWIIIHKHEDANFYLTLGAHTEGDEQILKRVRLACEFDQLPFRY